MKTVKFVVAQFIVLCCFYVVAQAEITIDDTWSASGKLTLEGVGWSVLFSKEAGALTVYSDGKETVKIAPFYSEKAKNIISCKVIDGKKEQLEIDASFSAGQDQIECRFFFDQEGAIQIEPLQNMKGILIFGDISYGVVPSPPLEDLIYDPKEYPSDTAINLPSENVFLGLLEGEDRIFFCAWPDGDQQVKLLLKEKRIEAYEIGVDGKSVYLKSSSAPGIWHKEEIRPDYLEKVVEINWKRPFSAKWKTQLLEGDIETAFPFVKQKSRTWRPNFGYYDYPVWFEGEKSFFNFSKKIPPSREAIIYALEENKNTPIEFARARLGSIPTIKQKTGLLRYPLDNVGIQNCDGRAWVKWIFKVDYQTQERDFLQEVMSDFLYSINVDKGRLAEYEAFIPRMKGKIDLWIENEKADPEVSLYLSQMKAKVEELEKEYWDKMNNSPVSDHLKYETEVINKLKVLIDEKGSEVYPEICYLLDKIQLWSDIESVPGRVGGLLREMFQQAGYECAHSAAIVKYAQEIRGDIRKFIISSETHETVY